MTVLGIDTATTVAAVGVVRDGRALSEVAEFSSVGHAARLPELASAALEQAGLDVADVQAIAVSRGPGSFTGLRVGVAFAKGVAFCGGSRLVGVSTLEALATAAPAGLTEVAAAIDARRGEVYLALFRRRGVDGAVARVTEDLALSPREAAQRILAAGLPGASWGVVGDAVERHPEAFAEIRRRGARIVPLGETTARGTTVARLGEQALRRGDVEALVPVYVRASAAERNLGKATLTTGKSMS